jgi:hypothetical protein
MVLRQHIVALTSRLVDRVCFEIVFRGIEAFREEGTPLPGQVPGSSAGLHDNT